MVVSSPLAFIHVWEVFLVSRAKKSIYLVYVDRGATEASHQGNFGVQEGILFGRHVVAFGSLFVKRGTAMLSMSRLNGKLLCFVYDAIISTVWNSSQKEMLV